MDLAGESPINVHFNVTRHFLVTQDQYVYGIVQHREISCGITAYCLFSVLTRRTFWVQLKTPREDGPADDESRWHLGFRVLPSSQVRAGQSLLQHQVGGLRRDHVSSVSLFRFSLSFLQVFHVWFRWEPTEHMYDVREALYNFHSIYTVVSAMYLSPPDVAIVWGEDVQQINGWSFQDGVISFYTKRVDSKLFL